MSEERWEQLWLFSSVVVLVFGAMTYGTVLLAEDVKLERKAYRDEVAARKDRWLAPVEIERIDDAKEAVSFETTLDFLGKPARDVKPLGWETFDPLPMTSTIGSGTFFYTTAKETSVTSERLARRSKDRDEWLDLWLAVETETLSNRMRRLLERRALRTKTRPFDEERVTTIWYEHYASFDDVTAYWTDRLGEPDRADGRVRLWVRGGRLYVQHGTSVQVIAGVSDGHVSE